MKAREITSNKTVFEPIKIELTIESEDELLALWHRLNISRKYVQSYFNSTDCDRVYRRPSNLFCTPFWQEIENIRIKRSINLYK